MRWEKGSVNLKLGFGAITTVYYFEGYPKSVLGIENIEFTWNSKVFL